MRTSLALIAILALAACKGGGGDANNSAVAVAAVSAPAGQQWVDVIQKTPDGGIRMGNPDAPIKLVEYGSRSCPHCKRFSEDSAGSLRDKYVASGRVSYEFRDFLVHPQIDVSAALLGHCVANEAFFPILDAMFATQDAMYKKLDSLPPNAQQILAGMNPQQAATWWAENAGYVDFMKQHGVPEPKVRQCLADPKALSEVSDVHTKAVNELGVGGTPTFFINGTKNDADSWAKLEPLLKAAGAR